MEYVLVGVADPAGLRGGSSGLFRGVKGRRGGLRWHINSISARSWLMSRARALGQALPGDESHPPGR